MQSIESRNLFDRYLLRKVSEVLCAACQKPVVAHRNGKCPSGPKRPHAEWAPHGRRFSEERFKEMIQFFFPKFSPLNAGPHTDPIWVARVSASCAELLEREACAKLAEDMGFNEVAAAIRGRKP